MFTNDLNRCLYIDEEDRSDLEWYTKCVLTVPGALFEIVDPNRVSGFRRAGQINQPPIRATVDA